MKILLLGATGMVGSRIAKEAVARGHEVTAVSRSGKSPGEARPNLTAVAGDASDTALVARLAGEHEAVASALAPPRDGSDPREPFTALYTALTDAVRASGTERLVVVGGAGSLLVGPGKRLVDTPDFPDAYKGEALAHHDVLTLLRGRGGDGLNWTYISPAAEIAPGERTGTFRLGDDRMLTAPDGSSRISAEDYAIAFVDELEQAVHPKRRISVVGI
ncbi:epimerase [Mangrovactinospora gilvigrisea]|uniref:Epimerase n=2 Tax=Mangrovactinospora gilvigrisea TaxID=1428644 RepID=A0A1J7BCA5_9ACTN|nr:epimerase [Mangrovactinospora gilvigrisea]